MFKTFSLALLGATAAANGFSIGVPPVTTYCKTYPSLPNMSGNFYSQSVAWGLTVDREFGGCRCADQDEMEFGPDAGNMAPDTWRCQCLNDDLYLSQPELTTECRKLANNKVLKPSAVEWTEASCNTEANRTAPFTGGRLLINDKNGKKCGVVLECQQLASQEQGANWNTERARAVQTKDSARLYAKKSMMPEGEMSRARILRVKATKQNRMRARLQVTGIAQKYRALKSAFRTGALDKLAFNKAHALTAQKISSFRKEFTDRQQDI